MNATINQQTTISLQLDMGDTNKYPQATIWNNTNTWHSEVDLTHVVNSNGLYTGIITPTVVGYWLVNFKVYSDAEHTIQDIYYDSIVSEQIFVQIQPEDVQILTDLSSIDTMVTLLKKYTENNELLDINNNQLIIYDDDGVTPILTFDLYDRNGNSAAFDIFERKKI